MRTLLVLLALTAAPALAQSPAPEAVSDSVAVGQFSFHPYGALSGSAPFASRVGVAGVYQATPETVVMLSTTVGARAPSPGLFLSVTPGVSHVRALGAGVDAGAVAGISFTASDFSEVGAEYHGERAFGAVALSRSFPLVGSVELVPTVGTYATAGRWLDATLPDSLGSGFASAGLLAGVGVRFRAFGRTWELPLIAPLELVGRDPYRQWGQLERRTVYTEEARAMLRQATSSLPQFETAPPLDIHQPRRNRRGRR